MICKERIPPCKVSLLTGKLNKLNLQGVFIDELQSNLFR